MIDDISPPGSWVRELSARPHTYRDVWAALREAEARIAEVEADRDALRVDAERYRWVRDEWYIKGRNLPWRDIEWDGDNPANLDEYDAAIDAAREAT